MFGWLKKLAGGSEGGLAGTGGLPTITPTAEMEIQEREDAKKIFQLFEQAVRKSGAFKSDAIDSALDRVRADQYPFSRVNLSGLIDGPTLLTVEEKRALGLNTRMKYSREFISLFEPSALSKIEPKGLVHNFYYDAFHRVARDRDISKYKATGFVARVEILPGDCPKIARFKKVHPIAELPSLPLSGCTADFCTCCLIAKIDI